MEKEEKRNPKIIILIMVLVFAIFGIAIAYSALTATLHINFSTISYNSATWNVGFDPGRVSAIRVGTKESICGEAVVTPNFVTIDNISLYTLHDKCIYKLKVINTGTLDAIIGSIAAKTPTASSCDTSTTSKMVCGNITYKLTKDIDGMKLLDIDEELKAKTGELEIYLYAEYTGLELGVIEEQNTAGFTLNYFQK